jgi:hypothetical protein
VVRIETAAMISGTNARNEAKTKRRTASAPTAPNRVGVPAGGQQGVGREAGLQPGSSRSLLHHGQHLRRDARAEPGGLWPLHQCEGAAPVLGDEPVVAGAAQVDDPDLRHGSPERVEDAGDVRLPVGHGAALGHGDHRDQRVGGAGAERGDEFLLGLVAGLAGQREVEGEPVGDRPGHDAAGHHQHQPAEDDDQPVPEDESGEGFHEVLPVRP